MSGLEIVLIVGAGIAIAHKLDERKKRKQRLQQISALSENSNGGDVSSSTQSASAATRRSEERVGSRLQRPNQQVPVEEEEALPLYSPPANDPSARNQEHLPTYDESRQGNTPELPSEKALSSSRTQVREVDDNDSPFADSNSQSRPMSRDLRSSSSVSHEPLATTFDDITSTPPQESTSPDKTKLAPSSRVKFWKRHSTVGTTKASS